MRTSCLNAKATGVNHLSAWKIACALLVFCAVAGIAAPAQTYSVLYAFHGGTDGASPYGALVRDAAGDLFGTTANGGKQLCNKAYGVGCGTVFKVDASGVETILHSFGGKADGFYPLSGVSGGGGTLYGSTELGGDLKGCNSPIGCGLIFKVDTRTLGFSVLHTFTGSPDGSFPGGLRNDSADNIYGLTSGGGVPSSACPKGCGTVFKVDATGVETVLYNFTGGADGGGPATNEGSGVVRDAGGNLYGTTASGGEIPCLGGPGCGVVFKVQPNGVETVLHTFTGTDGDNPLGGLIPSAFGNAFYGTTAYGGTHGRGTVFKVDVLGSYRVLYNFTGGADGTNPIFNLVRDLSSNLYGVAFGGSSPRGVVFKVDPTGVESVLYNFTGGADGGGPSGGLLLDAAGNLYGVTGAGGDLTCNPPNGCGVVFKIAP